MAKITFTVNMRSGKTELVMDEVVTNCSAIHDMMFWDEPTLTAQISEIKVMLDKPSRARDGAVFEKVMADLETETRLILNRLNLPIEGKAQRHVSDAVEDDAVTLKTRQARKVAVIDDEAVEVGPRRQSRKTGTDD